MSAKRKPIKPDQKKMQNIKIFAPKRKYNQPVGAMAVRNTDTFFGQFNGIELKLVNHTGRTIYVRGE